ncbi:MAG: hypothetical protein JNM07_09160 [Phycisphaerae bacterium]|nr:hypothetical protein [Phycisphaerae bacterium]
MRRSTALRTLALLSASSLLVACSGPAKQAATQCSDPYPETSPSRRSVLGFGDSLGYSVSSQPNAVQSARLREIRTATEVAGVHVE